MLRAIVFLLISHLSIATAFAQDVTGKDARLHLRQTSDFEITGEGTDPAWNTADWITLSRIKGSSPYITRAKLLYSEKGIYALYHCEDKKINATLQEDFTSLWREDVIEIFFWPDESFPIYLEYELSPLNYELAILVPNLNGQSAGWMPWNYKGQKKTRKATKVLRDADGNTTGWIGEFFIPYALLRPLQNVPPKKGTQWRANVYRIDYDEAESSYWSWQPVNNNFHEFRKYGTLVFD
ncbi:MAG: carbohydrate-binding family 9-like protein [Cyclobacteriaceae bacterium]